MVSGFRVSRAHDDGHVVVSVTGELDMATAPVLRDTFSELRHEHVYLDASGLTFVDSTGLSVLLAANRRWRENGRSLRLVNPSRPLRRLLELAGVDHAFDVEEPPTG